MLEVYLNKMGFLPMIDPPQHSIGRTFQNELGSWLLSTLENIRQTAIGGAKNVVHYNIVRHIQWNSNAQKK